jgi:hypothetical protein
MDDGASNSMNEVRASTKKESEAAKKRSVRVGGCSGRKRNE